MKKVLLALLIGGITIQASYARNARAWREAVGLYRHGMFERARTLFESQEDDFLSDDYAVLCAVKLRSSDCGSLVAALDSLHPKTILNSTIHHEFALYQFEAGNFKRAAAEFDKVDAGALNPIERAGYWYKRAYCEYSAGRYDEAISLYLKVEDCGATTYRGPARYALGTLFYEKSDFQTAASWFEKSKTDNRFSTLSEFFLVDCRFMMKDYDYVTANSESLYPKLTESQQKHLSRIVSESYMVKGNVSKAREYLEKEDVCGGTDEDYFHAASVLYASGDWNGAISNFTKMRNAADSIGQIACYQLAYSYIKTKNKVAALDAFKRASQMHFDENITEDAFFNCAKLAFDLNNDDKVFSDYVARYSTTRKGDLIYSYVAMGLLRRRDYEGAVNAYDNIEVLDSDQKRNYIKANYLRANQLLAQGSYSQAVKFLKADSYYLSKNDRLGQLCRYTLAQTWFNAEDYSNALRQYTELYNLAALGGRQEGRLIPYDIAWCHFRLKDYASAAKWFDTYIASKDNYAREDALLRRADCDFARRDYKGAIATYQASIADGNSSLYPRYYLGLSCGLAGKKAEKIEALLPVQKASPESKYYNEAFYELGRAYLENAQYQKADEVFAKLAFSTTDKSFVAKSFLGRGMSRYNAGDYDGAVTEYKAVIRDFPNTEYSEEALQSLQAAYQSMKQPEKFLEYVEANNLNAGKSEEEKRSLYYNTAEQVFLAGNYNGAVTQFTNYLSKYPSGANTSEAYYYLAESHKNLGQNEKALDYYRRSMNAAGSKDASHYKLAVVNRATLSYSLQLYEEALEAYREAGIDVGVMRSAYRLKKYDEAIDAGAKVLKAGPDKDLARETRYVQAQSYLSTSRRDKAFDNLAILAAEPSTAEGAEATFLIIKSDFDKGAFDKVENGVYAFAEKAGGQSYWLAKAFLVLGDSFLERGNAPQALATYESIAEGYEPYGEDDDVPALAAEKIAKLK